MDIKNAVICVHIAKECWDSGVLRPFFEDVVPDVRDLPIYFRATNCAFDQDSRCYVFKIPFLQEGAGVADVHIPREHVLGISVQHDTKSSKEEMRKLGFPTRVDK